LICSGERTPERVSSGDSRDRALPVEERGEGDGKEAPPHRAPSVAATTPVPRYVMQMSYSHCWEVNLLK